MKTFTVYCSNPETEEMATPVPFYVLGCMLNNASARLSGGQWVVHLVTDVPRGKRSCAFAAVRSSEALWKPELDTVHILLRRDVSYAANSQLIAVWVQLERVHPGSLRMPIDWSSVGACMPCGIDLLCGFPAIALQRCVENLIYLVDDPFVRVLAVREAIAVDIRKRICWCNTTYQRI